MSDTTPTQRSTDDADDLPVSSTIAELLSLLDRGLRRQSRFGLETANRAAAMSAGGQVIVTLPTKAGDLAEVTYCSGKPRLIID